MRDVLDNVIAYGQLCRTNLVRVALLGQYMSREHLAELCSPSARAYNNIVEDADLSDIRLLEWLGFMDKSDLVEPK